MPPALPVFCAGVLLSHLLPALPAPGPALALVAGLALTRQFLPAAGAAGLAWVALRAALGMPAPLPAGLDGMALVLRGRIGPAVIEQDGLTRFTFAAAPVTVGGATVTPGRLQLYWYAAEHRPRPGERWQLAVRVKRIRGAANPGSFDRERYAFVRRIAASGSVVATPRNRCLAQARGLDRLRNRVAANLAEARELRYAALLTTLIIGNAARIAPEHRRLLQDSGTAHLLAISGLHLSIVAGAGFMLARGAWSLSARAIAAMPAQYAGWAGALLLAAAYAALAGLALPAQRALVMWAVLALRAWRGQVVVGMDSLLTALAAVLLIDPFAPLAAGFWLSFTAVLVIFLVLPGAGGPLQPRWRRYAGLHARLALGMAPAGAILFAKVPLAAPLANLLAVPLVSLAVLPLALASAALMAAGGHAWLLPALLADRMLGAVLALLAVLDSALPAWQPGWTGAVPLVAAAVGVALLLLARGVPGRWLGAIWLLPLAAGVGGGAPPPGEAELSVLDVGQGLAVVVRTHRHTLLFDTGPASPYSNAGARIVLPYLRAEGLRRLDAVVISHGDSDHRGGLAGLTGAIPIATRIASPGVYPDGARRCQRGVQWRWDGVDFVFLHPDSTFIAASGNNASCVLKIVTASATLLLTGDIEHDAEAYLVASAREALAAEVMLVPHHGSLTSSTAAFLDAVAPAVAVLPVGAGNRFGLPDDRVLKRYARRQVPVYRTDRDGMVRLRSDRLSGGVLRYREAQRRYWRQR